MDAVVTLSPPPTLARYTRTAQALHWLSALLILAILPVAWVMVSLPSGNSTRSALFVLHKSLGITVLLLVAARLAWRAAHPAPTSAGLIPPALITIGLISHWLLYALLLVMPITGYLQSGNGRPVPFFWLFNIPGFPANRALDDVAEAVHLAGQWALYALIALHLLATVWHVALRRDGLLGRMLPVQRAI